MKLLLDSHIKQLKRNGQDASEGRDPWPVVKLFTPDAGCTWLLTAIDPDDEDLAEGLCDLGLGFAEFGSVRLSEIAEVRGRLKLPVERDIHWQASGPISAYINVSYPAGRIIEPKRATGHA